eukprot:g5630.t1
MALHPRLSSPPRVRRVGRRLSVLRTLATKPKSTSIRSAVPVCLRYSDLVNGVDLSSKISAAFGPSGLGLLTVSGVPSFPVLRRQLLPLSRRFAKLSAATKESYSHERSFYAFGWSHGKEKLSGGVPDYGKGSYYNNPLDNDPFHNDPDLVNRWPSFCHPNIWPKEHLPELEGAFMSCGQKVCEVGYMVARECDRYVKQRVQSIISLEEMIKSSRVTKARLLHYFPSDKANSRSKESQNQFSSWCGWHNDHGTLTGLVPGMLLDDSTGDEVDVSSIDDGETKKALAEAGLYIQTRTGEIVRAVVPKDHIAFQIGETAQIHSGGLLQATPHAVRGPGVCGISRESFAVFMEPEWDEPMQVPQGRSPRDVANNSKHLPAGVPPLSKRWGTKDCAFTTCDFGKFSEITYKAYLVEK